MLKRGGAPLLLLVDDDETWTQSLKVWLYGRGLNAVTATTCLEAAAVLDAMPIDGIIAHLALRDGSLFDLARTLRLRHGESDIRERGRRDRSLVVGYAEVDVIPPPELDGCFVKPVDLEVLGTLLGTHFGRHRSGEIRKPNLQCSVPPATLQARAVPPRRS